MTRARSLWIGTPGAATAIGLLIGPGALAVAGIWFLAALIMPGRTFLRQICYAAVALFGATASVLTALSLLGSRCSPRLLALAYLIVLVGLLTARQPALPPPWLDRADAWALSLGVVTTAVLALPLVGATPGEVMTLLSQTTDGGTHVQMVLGTEVRHGYFTLDAVAGMREGTETYPGGWAGNVWVMGSLVTGDSLSPAGAVRLVAFVVASTYGLLTLVAARVALALAHSLREGLNRRDEALVTALVALTTTGGFALFFVNLNSFTQLAAILALLVALLLLWEDHRPTASFLILGACVVTLAQSWYLISPMIGAVVLVALARLSAHRTLLIPLGIVVALLAAFPVLNGPGGDHVSAQGSQLLPTLPGVLGLLLAGFVAVIRLASRRGTEDTARLAWTAAFVAALALECVLLPFRPDDVPGTSYYAGKVLLVLFLLAGVAAAAVVVGHTATRSLGSLVIMLGLLVATWSTSDFALPPSLGHVEGNVNAQELDALLVRHPGGLPPDVDAWILDGCNRVGDLVASKWMYDLSLTWTSARSTALQTYADDAAKRTDMLVERASDPTVRSVEIVVARDCQPARIAELAKLPKVTVIRVP